MPAKGPEQKLSAAQIQGFYNPLKLKGVSCLCFTGLFCLNISEKQELIRRDFARLFESLRSSSTNRQEGNSAAQQNPLLVPFGSWAGVFFSVRLTLWSEKAKGAAPKGWKIPWACLVSGDVHLSLCLVPSKRLL